MLHYAQVKRLTKLIIFSFLFFTDDHKGKGNLKLWLWITLGCLAGVIVLLSMCLIIGCICLAGVFGAHYGETRAQMRRSPSHAASSYQHVRRHHDDSSDGESDVEVAANGAAVESENEDSPVAHGV